MVPKGHDSALLARWRHSSPLISTRCCHRSSPYCRSSASEQQADADVKWKVVVAVSGALCLGNATVAAPPYYSLEHQTHQGVGWPPAPARHGSGPENSFFAAPCNKVDALLDAARQLLLDSLRRNSSAQPLPHAVCSGFIVVNSHATCAVQTTGGAKAADPFEGMSPEEINAFIDKSRLMTAQS